ncbi:MAG: GatB/YqeY domain-containing protein [Alphaproteobacteria bacterium]
MLRDTFKQDLKDAQKSGDNSTRDTIRLIQAALKDRDIDARSKGNHDGIAEAEILSMLQSMIKSRNDSIAMYEQGGRVELAEREQAEIEVINRYLPTQMDEGEMSGAIDAVIADIGAETVKDMGKVMAALKDKYAGQMDFAKAAGAVKKRLCG